MLTAGIVAESFFGILKNELIYRRPWLTRRAAREAISEYIESFYNRIRRHSTIGNVSPARFEEMALATEAEAAQAGCPLLRNKVTPPFRSPRMRPGTWCRFGDSYLVRGAPLFESRTIAEIEGSALALGAAATLLGITLWTFRERSR